LRCFIGIRPSEGYLQEYKEQVYENKHFKLSKWFKLTPPENVHVTIKFLGEIDEQGPNYKKFMDELSRIKITEQTVRTKKYFEFFPLSGRPRILYHGVYEDQVGSLKDLACEIELVSPLVSSGTSKEVFVPHLTLGRAKRDMGSLDQEKRKTEYIKAFEVNFKVIGFSLFKSELKREGSIYTELVKFPCAMYNGA
jgi:2'-5' RNA ligase